MDTFYVVFIYQAKTRNTNDKKQKFAGALQNVCFNRVRNSQGKQLHLPFQ